MNDNPNINDGQNEELSQDQDNNPNDILPTTKPDNSVPIQPVIAPIDTQSLALSESNSNSPSTIILQWLTYTLWGGTVIAVSILTTLVLIFFLNKDVSLGDSALFSIAAVLVLLPASIICDIFYIKQEPEKKTGFSSIVMIVHSILFAIFAIMSLITIAFSVVNLTISNSDTNSTIVTLDSAIIIALLFSIIFLRTVMPKKLFKMRHYFIIIMTTLIGIICAFGIIGPVADARLTRNDRLIESNLADISYNIDTYATNNNKLPDDLNSIGLTGDAEILVTDNLVTYKKDSIPVSQYYESDYYSSETFYYQLCVVYKKSNSYLYTTPANDILLDTQTSDYQSNLITIPHLAGETCYKLMTSSYNGYGV